MRSPEWVHDRVTADGRQPSPVAVGVVVLVGLVLLAHPLYLAPHAGQTEYVLSDVERVTEDAPATSTAGVEYRALPPAAQAAFDEARGGGSATLWSGTDATAIDRLAANEFVRYQGDRYRYRLTHVDRVTVFGGLPRGLLTVLGSALVVVGSLVGYVNRWRPLTPLRSLWFPVVVTLGLLATRAYDVLYSGASGSVWLPNSIVALLPVTGVFLFGGSLLRRRGRTVVPPLATVGLAVLVTGAVVTGAPPVVPVVVGAASVIGGAPWFALGYGLTSPQ